MMSLLSFSQLLIFLFISSVTLWYCITPYLINPHPDIAKDMIQVGDLAISVLNEHLPHNELYFVVKAKLSGASASKNALQIENWTKWRLYVNSTMVTNQLIYANSRGNVVFDNEAVLNMEWRSDYHVHIKEEQSSIKVDKIAPFNSASDFGIYNHFEAKNSQKTVQVVPRFLFGISFDLIEQLYGTDVSKFPVVGIFTNSVRFDRVIIQIYMNIVTLSVVFLLYANNPPHTLVQAKKTS